MTSAIPSKSLISSGVLYFDCPSLPKPHGYSHVSKAKAGSRAVEIAGQIGVDESGKLAETFEEQVLLAFRHLKDCLATAGARPEDVTKIRYFIKDFQNDMTEALGKGLLSVFRPDHLPPSLLASVPRLADDSWLIEIEASAAIPESPASTPSPSSTQITETDVLVVGAGLSGLQTAVDLQKAGVQAVVLEAMDRIGGRTLSVSAVPGSANKVDLGAAWINDSSQTRMWDLARKYGIKTTEQRTEGLSLLVHADGTVGKTPYEKMHGDDHDNNTYVIPSLVELDELAKSINLDDPASSPGAREQDVITVSQWVQKNHPHPSVLPLYKKILPGMLGVEPEEISLQSYLHYIKSNYGLWDMLSDSKGGGQYLRVRGGTQQFSTALASELRPGSVKLSTAVKKIEQLGRKCIRVEASSDKIFYCKKVVVTVPSPVYNKIQFEPPLPASKQLVANSTKLGYYSKFVLVFTEPWWRAGPAPASGNISSVDGPITFTKDTSFPEDDMWAITCFMVGQIGRNWGSLTAAQRKEAVINQFNTAMSAVFDEVPEPIATHEVQWTSNEFCPGAPWPVMGPGTLTKGAVNALRAPYDDIHFAGTETSILSTGFMDGALRAGSRAAEEVMGSLNTV